MTQSPPVMASHSAHSGPTGALSLSARGRTLLVAACVIAVCCEAGFWLWFLWRALHAPVGQYDFSSYYAAASALRADPHANIYSQAVLARSGALGHVQIQPPLPYTYPPLFAIVVIPLTLLPFHIAARVWLVANAGLWIACTLVLAVEVRHLLRGAFGGARLAGGNAWQRAVSDPSWAVALAACAMLCLSFAPAQQTLLTGQIDLLVLLSLALVPWLTRHRQEGWVGAALAVAAMLKLTPGILLIYLALRRRWEALGAAVAVLAVVSAGSIVVVGPGTFLSAFAQALHTGSGDIALGHNEALFAPLVNQLTAASPAAADVIRLAAYALVVVLALGIGIVVARARPTFARSSETAGTETLPYCIALCGLLLLAPTAWIHHYVWVLPSAALLLGLTLSAFLRAADAVTRRRAAMRAGVTVLAAIAIGWMLPHEWDTQPHPTTDLFLGLPLHTPMLELRALGTVALLGVALSLLHRAPRPAGTARLDTKGS